MSDKIPEWAMAEARGIANSFGLQTGIARAIAATAARVERERRDADVALIERHDRVYAKAVRALPLKYQEAVEPGPDINPIDEINSVFPPMENGND